MMILDFMVPYETDITALRETLMDVMRADELLCQEETMEVVIDKLSPVKIKMQMKAWAKTEQYWDARYGLLEKLKETLEENGVKMGL